MRITVSGISETESLFREIAARARDLTPVLEVAAADTVTLIDDSFEAGSAPDDAPWAPLSPATVAIRNRRRGRGIVKPLQDTTRLRRSITATGGASRLAFGTNVPYAAPQQLGASIRIFGRGSASIPARAFLPVTSGEGGRFSLMTGGRAGVHWTRVRAMVDRYIRTGEIV